MYVCDSECVYVIVRVCVCGSECVCDSEGVCMW